MKMTILLFVFGLLAIGSFAQHSSLEDQAAQATAELTERYQLNAEQATKMLYIQQTRLHNIASVAELEASDPQTYIKKMKSIQSGMETSVQMLLDEEQVKVFYNELIKRRQRQADLARKMQDEGATPQQIELALVNME